MQEDERKNGAPEDMETMGGVTKDVGIRSGSGFADDTEEAGDFDFRVDTGGIFEEDEEEEEYQE